MNDQWQTIIVFISIASMIFGAVAAIGQKNLKRLIAYSGVIQSGFILSGISSGVYGISASTFYLITYIIQLIGIFTVFSIISGQLSSDFQISNISGLFKENKFITITFSIFMLGLAGLPLTSGFVSKFILITNLWSYERYILVTVLMLTTVAGFYFYLRPIWVAAVEKTENVVEKIQVKNSDKLLLGVLAALTIYFGLLPDTLVNITRWMVEGYL